MDRKSENLIVNGRFENQTLNNWVTDIDQLKFESVKNSPGAFSLYMPVNKYIEQKIDGPLSTEEFKLRWQCKARIDSPAHMGSLLVFMVYVFIGESNDPNISSSAFNLSSEWGSFKYEHLAVYPSNVREVFLQVHNANWANLEGAFNAPVQITDIEMALL